MSTAKPPVMAISLAVVVLAISAAAAWMFRYETVPTIDTSLGTVQVWDRWEHRLCIAAFKNGRGLVCSK